jgi:hypothetical protein
VTATLTCFAPVQDVPTTTCNREPSDEDAFSLAPGMAAFSVLAESARPGPYWMTVVVTPCRVPGATLVPKPTSCSWWAALVASPSVPTPLTTRTSI